MVPISLRVEGREVLIVGAGEVAARKAAGFVEAGARVRFVAPAACDAVAAAVQGGRARHVEREFDEGDLDGVFVAVAATSDPDTNDAMIRAARARGVLACASGRGSERGDFHLAAVLRQGGLTVAVSSGVPVLSVAVRDVIAEALDPAFGRAATMLARVRDEVNSRFAPDERGPGWRGLVALLPEAAATRESARQWLAGLVEQPEQLLDEVDWS